LRRERYCPKFRFPHLGEHIELNCIHPRDIAAPHPTAIPVSHCRDFGRPIEGEQHSGTIHTVWPVFDRQARANCFRPLSHWERRLRRGRSAPLDHSRRGDGIRSSGPATLETRRLPWLTPPNDLIEDGSSWIAHRRAPYSVSHLRPPLLNLLYSVSSLGMLTLVFRSVPTGPNRVSPRRVLNKNSRMNHHLRIEIAVHS